jgi:hypothetical protein
MVEIETAANPRDNNRKASTRVWFNIGRRPLHAKHAIVDTIAIILQIFTDRSES